MPVLTFSPDIGPSPGTTTKRKINLLRADFGDGYQQAIPNGLNHIRREVSLKWDGLTQIQASYIDQFLTAHGGYVSFFYTPAGYGAPVLWTCEDWSISVSAPFSASASFKESFNLGTSGLVWTPPVDGSGDGLGSGSGSASTGGTIGGGGTIISSQENLYIQEARPTAPGPWMWWQLDASGNVIGLVVNNGVN